MVMLFAIFSAFLPADPITHITMLGTRADSGLSIANEARRLFRRICICRGQGRPSYNVRNSTVFVYQT